MPSWDNLDWNRCEQLAQDADRIPQQPGTYAVRCAPGGEPRVVCRAFGPDKSGILCFGRTTQTTKGLRGRIGAFLRCSGGVGSGHAEGERYHQLRYAEHGFRQGDLEVAWVAFSAPDQAKRQELSWFDEYSDVFGELPPLNRKRG